MVFIEVSPEQYGMKNGVYLPKNGLPPAVYLGKTHFRGSPASSLFLHTIRELTPLKACLVGI